MKTKIEKLKKLREKIQGLATEGNLRDQIAKVNARLAELKTEILKAETLESPDLKKLKVEEQELENRLRELEHELSRIAVARKIIEAEKLKLGAELEAEARKQIFEELWPAYQKKAVELVEKLREAERIEKELVEIDIKSEEKMKEILGYYPRMGIFRKFDRILSKARPVGVSSDKEGRPTWILATPLDDLVKSFEEMGISLPDDIGTHNKDDERWLRY